MNPYTILEPTCISFSGGRTSAFMLHKVLLNGGGQLPDQAKVIFCNTGKEDEATLQFVKDCSDQWNVPITWLEYISEEPKFKVVNFEIGNPNKWISLKLFFGFFVCCIPIHLKSYSRNFTSALIAYPFFKSILLTNFP